MPNGTIDASIEFIEKLDVESSDRWPHLEKARENAIEVRQLLSSELRCFTSDDVDVVVFGSLARREWTSGSDVDWTMLIDGQADTQHRVTAQAIEGLLRELKYKEAPLKGPGGEGIFGNMVFSHDIVHHIGGQADSNRNTTQRILMLLEAMALRDPKDELGGSYARVVRQILNRYLKSDSNFHSKTDNQSRIPRFLMNDIVRYWRTMCVDFAYKDWEQAGKKWAIRNIKLRTSRKLLFVAGLFMVFSCYQNPSLNRDDSDSEEYALRLQEHLLHFVRATPLNTFVWTLVQLGFTKECCDFLDDYESFLGELNNSDVRERLEKLDERLVYDDPTFMKCREISHLLQKTLNKVCFEIDSPLREFTFEYGVF
jgi:predicted nucleotidyltransferase